MNKHNENEYIKLNTTLGTQKKVPSLDSPFNH